MGSSVGLRMWVDISLVWETGLLGQGVLCTRPFGIVTLGQESSPAYVCFDKGVIGIFHIEA